MVLARTDAAAIAGAAQQLGVDPRTLGALMELESGVNPNIWGGAGKQYRGLIQFGPGARKEVGLPERPMTIAEQVPYVVKYFQQRGFQPGKHGPTELYRTVLVGNPHQSGTDSFGTNSDRAAQRMLPGGDLYRRFAAKFEPAAQDLPLAAAGSGSGGGLPGLDLGELLGNASPAPSRPAGGLDVSAIARAALAAPTAPQRLAGSALLAPGGELAGAMMAVLGPAAPAVQDLATGGGLPTAAAALPPAASSGGETMDLVAFGRELQRRGLKVGEHPAFGRVGRHSPNSHHYNAAALDITDWNGGDWRARKRAIGEAMYQALGRQAEVFHPGRDPVGGHHEHIHFGGLKALPAPAAQQILASVDQAFRRYPVR